VRTIASSQIHSLHGGPIAKAIRGFPVSILGGLLLWSPAANVMAQCSDAGACTISRHAETGEKQALKQTVAVRYIFGQSGSPDDVRFHSIVAEANLHLFPQSRVILTLPFNNLSGPSGDVSGVGDLIAIWDQTAVEWEGGLGRLGAQIGGRFGTGDANAEPTLPMAYQPGLGSTDLILGLTASYSGWSAGGAYQVAGARNDNELVQLMRGDQILLWGGYELAWEKTRLFPGITVINQLQKSSVRDTTAGAIGTVSVSDSDQLQVNISLRARHELSPSLGVELFGAIPLRPRDVNVDGLKRALTLSASISVSL
jgi:hypothetical protein